MIRALLEFRAFYGPEYAIGLLRNVINRPKSHRMSPKCIKFSPKLRKMQNRTQKSFWALDESGRPLSGDTKYPPPGKNHFKKREIEPFFQKFLVDGNIGTMLIRGAWFLFCMIEWSNRIDHTDEKCIEMSCNDSNFLNLETFKISRNRVQIYIDLQLSCTSGNHANPTWSSKTYGLWDANVGNLLQKCTNGFKLLLNQI